MSDGVTLSSVSVGDTLPDLSIDITTSLINKRPDRSDDPFHIERIPLDDPATYTLLQSGETTNVFQLESTGMQALIKRLKPDCF